MVDEKAREISPVIRGQNTRFNRHLSLMMSNKSVKIVTYHWRMQDISWASLQTV